MWEAALVNNANCHTNLLIWDEGWHIFSFSFPEVSDQNFWEEEVNAEANDGPYKKSKPTSRVVPIDQPT
jgi:hypothetical protein